MNDKKSGRISEDPCSLSMNNILRVQVEYLHSLNVSITEAIVKMSHVRFNGNIYIPAKTPHLQFYTPVPVWQSDTLS